MIAHGSALFNWTLVWAGVPIAIMLFVDDDTVIGNAAEALNYGICCFILSFIIGILIFCTLGLGAFLLIPLGPVFLIINLLPLFGVIKVAMNPESVFRYPFAPRLFGGKKAITKDS